MAQKSKIEWTEATWNPVTGCTKISDGCENCYAYTMAKRLKAMKNVRYEKGFKVTLHDDIIERPLSWKKPKCIFANSMSDLFHEDVPVSFIKKVYNMMGEASWHIFQVLTKRTKRLAELSSVLSWSSNIWQGVTVESEKYLYRIDDLRKAPAKVRFISFEPLISEINKVDLAGIDWVIVGGESGPASRTMEKEWVIKIRDKCIKENIPFFFKQWGGFNKKKNGRLLEGKVWDQYPEEIKQLEKNITIYNS